MFEKVAPGHPDKQADRIGGFIVDLAYRLQKNPKVAVEVLLGHGNCKIMVESSIPKDTMTEHLPEIYSAVNRINGMETDTEILYTAQDEHLAANQKGEIRCGDNGIFKGMPLTQEQKMLALIAREIYAKYPSDGKYILDEKSDRLIICQSNADADELRAWLEETFPGELPNHIEINPLGYWTGGSDVDTGAGNRKLGSDMADSVTGGGVHMKDLSKADVSVNIYAFLKAQQTGQPVELCCAIGDKYIDGRPFSEVVAIAKDYIRSVGGFEAFACWGLV